MPDDPNQPPDQPSIPPNPPETTLPEEIPPSEPSPPSEPETPPTPEPSAAEVPSQPSQSPQIPQPQIIEKEVIKEVPVEVIKEVIKEVPVERIVEKVIEIPTPFVDQNEVNKQVEEKLQQRLKENLALNRQKAKEAKLKKKEDNLAKLLQFTQSKGTITSSEASTYLKISKSTATKYLKELVNRGLLKKIGKAQYST